MYLKKEYATNFIQYGELRIHTLNNPLSDFCQQFIKIEDTAKNTVIENISVSQSCDSPNCYIYCMSNEFDKKLHGEFETDVCIKIKKHYLYMKAISVALREKNINFFTYLRLSIAAENSNSEITTTIIMQLLNQKVLKIKKKLGQSGFLQTHYETA